MSYPPNRNQSYAPQGQQYPPQQAQSYAQRPNSQYPPRQQYGQAQPPNYAQGRSYQAPQHTPSHNQQQQYNAPSHAQSAPVQRGGWVSEYYNQVPPQQLQALRAWFQRVDRDNSGTVEPHELQHVSFEGVPLGLPAATKIVKVFDKDRNGAIDLYEYVAMHQFISRMRNAFLKADSDRSGRLEAREIQGALSQAGFGFVEYATTSELLHKFDQTRRGLSWVEFLMLAGHIAHARSMFEYNDHNRSGQITININQFVQLMSYLT